MLVSLSSLPRTTLACMAALALLGCGPSQAPYKGITRTYYIAADDVLWDYAPSGKDVITGFPIGDPDDPDGDSPAIYLQQTPKTIGSRNWKALYREYTDATFTQLKPVDPRWKHLGMLGPVIRGVVGDTIQVVFKNNTSHLPDPFQKLSVHPHGVFYDKASEGAPYDDGTGAKGDDGVAPGETYTYTWKVSERAGPGPHDGSSVLWMYHSHVHEADDTYAGLIGPMIVTGAEFARNNADVDPSPRDVDREFVTMFEVSDESQSPYLAYNMSQAHVTVDPADEEFQESNKKHSINGYVFGNLPLDGLTMYLGEHVRWYVFDMGTEVDLHTPHWHGNTLLTSGMRTDVMTLLPGTMVIGDMTPDNAGIWLFHCHVNDHIRAGMIARYQVCKKPGDADCKSGEYPETESAP